MMRRSTIFESFFLQGSLRGLGVLYRFPLLNYNAYVSDDLKPSIIRMAQRPRLSSKGCR
jgi:hypothetical protein